jgi:hypothetical protein
LRTIFGSQYVDKFVEFIAELDQVVADISEDAVSAIHQGIELAFETPKKVFRARPRIKHSAGRARATWRRGVSVPAASHRLNRRGGGGSGDGLR